MLLNTTVATTVLDVKLTSKGKELLSKGLNERDFFDIVKFSFGDSEIDYESNPSIAIGTRASSDSIPFKSRLFSTGVIPTGDAIISLFPGNIDITKGSSVLIAAETTWPPISGIYYENYSWQNLGPMSDYDFTITVDENTRSASIISYDVIGTSTIKVTGQISGKYKIITLNIT
jgi:hypothetical protein